MKRSDLLGERASRARSFLAFSALGYLPDPDPVLQKAGLALSTYRTLLSDDHVWACISSRKAGTQGSEFSIDAASDSAPDKRAADLCRDVVAALDTERINGEILDATNFGMSPLEIMWRADGARWIWDDLVGKPPEWFVFDDQNRCRFLSNAAPTDGEELPESKFLLARHQPSYLNPYGERVLSRCFWPVTFKRGGLKFWVNFCERFGMPWPVATVPRNTPIEKKDALADRLEELVQDGVLILEEGENLVPFESGDKRASSDLYARLVFQCESSISKAMLGQTLSTQTGDTGSYAAVKGHLEVRDDFIDADKRLVKSVWERGFAILIEMNVAGAKPPVWSWFQEDDPKKEFAERDALLAEKIGAQFTDDYLVRQYNLQPGDLAKTRAAIDAATVGAFSEDERAAELVRILRRIKDLGARA